MAGKSFVHQDAPEKVILRALSKVMPASNLVQSLENSTEDGNYESRKV